MNYLSLRGFFGTYDNAVFGLALILIISLAPAGPLAPLGLAIRRLFGRLAPNVAGREAGRDAA
jgi:hypothetical protein